MRVMCRPITLAAVILLARMAWAGVPFGEEGLVAWWPLDEATGEAVRDAAGGHDGRVHGSPARVPGPFGGHALAFFGRGQMVTGADKGFPKGREPG